MSHTLYHIDIAIILSRPVITTSCHLLRRLPGTNFLELLELFPDDEDENNNSSSSSIDGKIDNLRGCSSDDDGSSNSSSKNIILKDDVELRIATAFNSDVENNDTSTSKNKNTIHTGDDNDCDDQLSHVNTHAINNNNDVNNNNDINNNNNDHNVIAVDRATFITNKLKQAFAPILDASPYRIHINSINNDSNTTSAAAAFAFNFHQTLDINHTDNNYHHHYHRAVTSNQKNNNRIDDDDVYINDDDDDVHLNYVNNDNDALVDDEDEDGIDGIDKTKMTMNHHSMNSSRRSMTDVNNINTAPLSHPSPLLSSQSLPLSSAAAAYVSDSMFTLIVDRVESKILQLLHDYQSSLSLSILSQLKRMVESLELFGTLDYTHFYHHHHHNQQNDPHHNPDQQHHNHDHHHGSDDNDGDGIMDSTTVWNESTVRYLLRLPVFNIKFHSEVNSLYMKMMHDDNYDHDLQDKKIGKDDAVVDNHFHCNLKSTVISFNVS